MTHQLVYRHTAKWARQTVLKQFKNYFQSFECQWGCHIFLIFRGHVTQMRPRGVLVFILPPPSFPFLLLRLLFLLYLLLFFVMLISVPPSSFSLFFFITSPRPRSTPFRPPCHSTSLLNQVYCYTEPHEEICYVNSTGGWTTTVVPLGISLSSREWVFWSRWESRCRWGWRWWCWLDAISGDDDWNVRMRMIRT